MVTTTWLQPRVHSFKLVKKNGFVNVNPHLSFLHHNIKTLVDQAYFANTWNKIQFTTATVGFNPNSTKTKDAVWAVQSR